MGSWMLDRFVVERLSEPLEKVRIYLTDFEFQARVVEITFEQARKLGHDDKEEENAQVFMNRSLTTSRTNVSWIEEEV